MNVSILIKNLILFVCFVDLISTQEYNVRDFGAIGDGVTNDTKAVRDAWAAAAKTNGGRVIFDAGYNFLTAPFNLTTNGILDVRGTITASRNRSDYYPIPKEPW
uniref:Pectate lyase superfamily protein domain-containing protein n=1 Tax=Acrobeloides nanus TaxID=290746 RepID=A0A914E969_9BILA